MDKKEIIKHAEFAQVGFVVNDIEATKRKFAELFGCEMPPTVAGGDFKVTQTTIKGKVAPEANCSLSFFDLAPGVQLELIEPNEKQSVWRDELERSGEGIHHIAFRVDDTESVVEQLKESFEGVVEQQGNYADGSGRYTYVSLHKLLKCRIELLESFSK
ncbi:MAG: VOC family protein [Bacteroidaceae bacterium]